MLFWGLVGILVILYGLVVVCIQVDLHLLVVRTLFELYENMYHAEVKNNFPSHVELFLVDNLEWRLVYILDVGAVLGIYRLVAVGFVLV